MLQQEIKYMQYALQIAKKGGREVLTNPKVGAVIVYKDRIIGEGYHKKYGETHAEVNAISSVSKEDLQHLPNSTIYVTLEPCCHYGKTPPCTELIITMGIRRVVIGMEDPFPRVAGGGIKQLREFGIEVIVGVCEKECRELNIDYITFNAERRPYIIFKWAQTLDGYLDADRPVTTPPAWLTGERCKQLVHKWRSEEHGIMVGTNSVIMDDPSLTVRLWSGENPHRYTFDRRGKIRKGSYKIIDNEAPTTIFTYEDIEEVMDYLYLNRVKSLFVEGGATLFNALLSQNLIDEARVFVAPTLLSELYEGKYLTGVKAPLLPSPLASKVELIDTILLKTCYYRQ